MHRAFWLDFPCLQVNSAKSKRAGPCFALCGHAVPGSDPRRPAHPLGDVELPARTPCGRVWKCQVTLPPASEAPVWPGPRAQTLGARAVVRHMYANVRCMVLEVSIDLVRTFHWYLPLTSTKLRAYFGHGHLLTEVLAVQEPGRRGRRGPQARGLESVLQLHSQCPWAWSPAWSRGPFTPSLLPGEQDSVAAASDRWRQNLETKMVFAFGWTETRRPTPASAAGSRVPESCEND